MGDWQRELLALLAALEVSLERDGAAGNAALSAPLQESARTVDAESDTAASASAAAAGAEADDAAPQGIEVSAIRSEMEATLAEVMRLVQLGRLERSLGDDVIHVLRALTRPRPATRATRTRRGARDVAQEWDLASAAAVLHFCRIVLRLTRVVESDDTI